MQKLAHQKANQLSFHTPTNQNKKKNAQRRIDSTKEINRTLRTRLINWKHTAELLSDQFRGIMTSYATLNDSPTTAANAPVAEVAGVEYDTSLPISSSSSKIAASPLLQDLSHTSVILNSDDYDFDSLSEGREKADTTPENIKKIDDVIEQQQSSKATAEAFHCQNHSEPSTKEAASATLHTTQSTIEYDGCAAIGLSAAVDESNAKLFYSKPLVSRKDIRCKSDCIENSVSSLSPLHTVTNNNNNNIDINEIQPKSNEVLDEDDSFAPCTTKTLTTNKQSFAFTIDNFNEKDCDSTAAQAKYKNMLERFQNRHRRGVSMSKLENAPYNEAIIEKELVAVLTSSASAAPLTLRNSRNSNCRHSNSTSIDTESDASAAAPKVKLRARDRSTSRIRDVSKRHSWSPRSTTQELTHKSESKKQIYNMVPLQHKVLPPARKSSTKSKPPPLQLPKGATNLMANRTQFTPRSTVMQMALQKVDFLCLQPPLADFKHLNLDADDVSEAGTYTLDGDNYTEEQKDLMNIDDRSGGRRQQKKHRPKDLNLHATNSDGIANATKIPVHISSSNSNNRTNNVLEVNYYHEADESNISTGGDFILGNHQSADAYLEKIKSRVLRNMSGTKNTPVVECGIGLPHKQLLANNALKDSMEDEDMGCFTSVTTSGVLAKQSALDPRPKLTRRSSLSTSQIDSSEYVSNESKLKTSTASAYASGGFTDHQKAEYRLNLFTNQKDATQNCFSTRNIIESPAETPISNDISSDTVFLKTAQTKNDWIQEWARNARARSLASDCSKQQNAASSNKHDHQQDLMTRSYTCSDTGGCTADSLTDDTIYRKQCTAKLLNKTFTDRYRLVAGDCDYASDPALSTSYTKSHQDTVYKPPKSPSKIPSPLHSIGRGRSASRTRTSLQNILNQDYDDVYLQKTAAAISHLQESISRKSSLKSPTHSASPRAHSVRADVLYSPEDRSPHHSFESPTATAYHNQHHHVSSMHRHNLSHDPFSQRNYHQNAHNQLMTSSINEQQLQLLTSGEYLVKQMRRRKNSFDGGNAGNSPARRVFAHVPTSPHANEDQSLSPLRRSNSFSAKVAATQRAARPQFQNIYTPPALRHNYTLVGQTPQTQIAIKKSASSNNFRQVYSDYDDNLQYYINDEDDLGDNGEYYSSGGEEELPATRDEENYYYNDHVAANTEEHVPPVPLSNTRYNKALLMRIERSKQKVALNSSSTKGPSIATSGGGGVVACPNTPEFPRRTVKSAPRCGITRQSMPRDNSLRRLAQQVPSSLALAKKQLLQTAAAVPPATKTPSSNLRVQPKYMDISKYKPAQGNNFLRKNDAKSTLKAPQTAADVMKRSPSNSSMGLNRADPTRASNRSVRSVASCMITSATSVGSGRASSAVRRDVSVTKQKETEMAMWKRRSTYDPMKAAAEDRRKKEEVKRLAMAKDVGEISYESARTQPVYSQQSSLNQQWTLGESEFDD